MDTIDKFRPERFAGPMIVTLPEDVEKSDYQEQEHPRAADGKWTAGQSGAGGQQVERLIEIDHKLSLQLDGWKRAAKSLTTKMYEVDKVKAVDASESLVVTEQAARLARKAVRENNTNTTDRDDVELFATYGDSGKLEALCYFYQEPDRQGYWHMLYMATAPWNNHYVNNILKTKPKDADAARRLGTHVARLAVKHNMPMTFSPATPAVRRLYTMLGARPPYEGSTRLVWDVAAMKQFLDRYDKANYQDVFDEPVIAIPDGFEIKADYDPDEHPRDASGKWTTSQQLPTAQFEDDYEFVGDDEYLEWVNESYDHVPALTREAVNMYTSVSYKAINEVLRNPNPNTDDTPAHYTNGTHVGRIIASIDKAIQMSPRLPKNVYAYRGIKGSFAVTISSLEEGDEFQDDGFISVSTSDLDAATFTGSAHGGVIVDVLLDKGQKVTIGMTGEHELILPRETRFRVVRKQNGHITLGVVK